MHEGILFLYDHSMQGYSCNFACLASGPAAGGFVYRDIRYLILLENFDIPKCLCSVRVGLFSNESSKSSLVTPE